MDKAIATRPWHAMIKTVDLWKRRDATVMVFKDLFAFICLHICFILFICVQVELADLYLLLGRILWQVIFKQSTHLVCF